MENDLTSMQMKPVKIQKKTIYLSQANSLNIILTLNKSLSIDKLLH